MPASPIALIRATNAFEDPLGAEFPIPPSDSRLGKACTVTDVQVCVQTFEGAHDIFVLITPDLYFVNLSSEQEVHSHQYFKICSSSSSEGCIRHLRDADVAISFADCVVTLSVLQED